jgi:hypothetical protein
LIDFLNSMATPSPQVQEARLRAVAIEKILWRKALHQDATIGLKLPAFAPDDALLAAPANDPLLPATPDAAAVEKKVRKQLAQVVECDLNDDEWRDWDRYFRRRKLTAKDDHFQILLDVALLLMIDRIGDFFETERQQAAEQERRRVLTTLTGGVLLRLGQSQANSDEIIAEVFRVWRPTNGGSATSRAS